MKINLTFMQKSVDSMGIFLYSGKIPGNVRPDFLTTLAVVLSFLRLPFEVAFSICGASMLDMRDVRNKYSQHKSRAKRRGIEFKFTFDQWWEIWKPHWHNRGKNKGQFVMCRTMDKGGYEPGNVRIDTPAGNARTRSYVQFDNKWAIIKKAHEPVIAEELADDTESDFEKDWTPRHLKGYSKRDGWIT